MYFCIMIQIEDKIISLDVFQKHFVCDLSACRGACCIEGDSGAPLEDKEKEIIEEDIETIKSYMTDQGIKEIETQGAAIYDDDGDLTTPLVNNRECAFSIKEDGILKCSIEKAFINGKTNFKKPISCHLFPIRIKSYKDFDAINYERLDICNSARKCGEKLKIPVYVFLKESLIRKYGEAWYQELVKSAAALENYQE